MVKMPKNGEIIYIDFDPSAGSEIQKRRPAVMVSNNQMMATSPFVWGRTNIAREVQWRRLSFTCSLGRSN